MKQLTLILVLLELLVVGRVFGEERLELEEGSAGEVNQKEEFSSVFPALVARAEPKRISVDLQEIAIAPSQNGRSFNRMQFRGAAVENLWINNSRYDGKVGEIWIAGNGNLLREEAEEIVLELDEERVLTLSGELRVMGRRAKLVIVNRGGIKCSGCKFINVSEVELRGGKALVAQGNISYVQGGNVYIDV